MRILYIHASMIPPPADETTDRFFLLSKNLEGDVLQPVWFRSPEEVEELFGPGSFPVYTRGRFRYHWFLGFRHGGLRGRIAQFWFYVRKGVQIHRERQYDCIVAYSHMTTALMGAIVKILTRAKLIPEIATSPDLTYITHSAKPPLSDRLMKLYSDICLHLSVWFSDRVHLLYPTQLSKYPLLKRARSSVFHEYVLVSKIPVRQADSERYVLFVGSPWYLKGVDRLTEAFRRLAPDFPDVKLKILGWYGDKKPWEALANGCSQIELLRARPNPETLEIISKCEVLVQPSRCEGMGRVIVEGMGAGVPVIGSDAGGIPYVVGDSGSGFVIPGGDPGGIEVRLRQLLEDKDLRARMGAKGYERAHTELTEQVYVEKFTEMVGAAVQNRA